MKCVSVVQVKDGKRVGATTSALGPTVRPHRTALPPSDVQTRPAAQQRHELAFACHLVSTIGAAAAIPSPPCSHATASANHDWPRSSGMTLRLLPISPEVLAPQRRDLRSGEAAAAARPQQQRAVAAAPASIVAIGRAAGA